MAKVRLGLNRMSLDDKEMKCADVEKGYTDHPTVFTTGATRKVAVAADRVNLHNKRAEISAAEGALATLYSEQHDLEDAVDVRLTGEGTYVESVANGDATIILMANLEVQDAASAKPMPGKVANLSTSSGDDDGEGEAGWKPQRDVADDYEVQTATAADGPWTHFDVVKKSKVTLTGMTSGAKLFVRVRARNNTGKGPWSDIACVRIT